MFTFLISFQLCFCHQGAQAPGWTAAASAPSPTMIVAAPLQGSAFSLAPGQEPQPAALIYWYQVMDMTRQEIIRSMELSGIAYSQQQPTLSQEPLLIIDDPRSGVQCFLRRGPGTLWITFRGTDSAQDWHTDFTFWKKTIPYGNTDSKIRVHAGFLQAYKSPPVRERIQELVTGEVRRLRIAGHSYGAALAVLCGVDLQYNFPDRDIEVLLFGCPRVGNRAFAKSYNKRVFKTLRVENGNDIVTKVPFACWGYRHVGACLPVGPPRVAGAVSLSDHRPQAYYAQLIDRLL